MCLFQWIQFIKLKGRQAGFDTSENLFLPLGILCRTSALFSRREFCIFLRFDWLCGGFNAGNWWKNWNFSETNCVTHNECVCVCMKWDPFKYSKHSSPLWRDANQWNFCVSFFFLLKRHRQVKWPNIYVKYNSMTHRLIPSPIQDSFIVGCISELCLTFYWNIKVL